MNEQVEADLADVAAGKDNGRGRVVAGIPAHQGRCWEWGASEPEAGGQDVRARALDTVGSAGGAHGHALDRVGAVSVHGEQLTRGQPG
jgi:hypothetical protein